MASRFVWLPVGLFIVWSAIAHQWYVCGIKRACEGAPETASGETSVAPSKPAVQPSEGAANAGAVTAAEVPTTAPGPSTLVPKPSPEPDETPRFDDRVDIRFAHASDSAEANQMIDDFLDRLAGHLQQTSSVVTLVGHTDSKGSAAFNQQLGLHRAEHIRARLIRRGVAPERLKVGSMGGTSPVASNDTETGRQQNRRVEIVLDGSP